MPSCITEARASFSAIWLFVVSKTTTLPFSSATLIGAAGIPANVKTVISICGKARRMESASIHAYTHFRITLHAFACALLPGQSVHTGRLVRWVKPEELSGFAMGKVDRLIAQKLQE